MRDYPSSVPFIVQHSTMRIDLKEQNSLADSIPLTLVTSSSVKAQAPAPAQMPQAQVRDLHEWALRKKIYVTGILYLGVFSLTFSSSAYSSSIPQIREAFGISQEVALLGIALFVLGFSFSPLLFAPLSLIIGHRWTYIISFTMYAAFSFGASEANSGATLIIMRFLAATAGGSMFNNSPATVQDYATLPQMNRFTIPFGIAAFGGPGLGPVIAAFVTNRAGWRWNLRVQAILVAIVLILTVLFVPETNKAVLESRASGTKMKKGSLFLKRLLGPWKYFLDPVALSICAYLSILYGVLYGFFGIIPHVFNGIRGFSAESTGLVFISLVVGFLTAGWIYFFPQQWYYDKLAKAGGPANIKPEDRFQHTLVTAWLVPIGLFIFAWTAPFTGVHWIAPVIGMVLFAVGMGCVFSSFIPFLAVYGGAEAPLVLAAATFSRSMCGASFPLFITQMNERLTIQGANSLLAGLTLLLAPLPVLFKWKGAALRERAAKRRAQIIS